MVNQVLCCASCNKHLREDPLFTMKCGHNFCYQCIGLVTSKYINRLLEAGFVGQNPQGIVDNGDVWGLGTEQQIDDLGKYQDDEVLACGLCLKKTVYGAAKLYWALPNVGLNFAIQENNRLRGIIALLIKEPHLAKYLQMDGDGEYDWRNDNIETFRGQVAAVHENNFLNNLEKINPNFSTIKNNQDDSKSQLDLTGDMDLSEILIMSQFNNNNNFENNNSQCAFNYNVTENDPLQMGINMTPQRSNMNSAALATPVQRPSAGHHSCMKFNLHQTLPYGSSMGKGREKPIRLCHRSDLKYNLPAPVNFPQTLREKSPDLGPGWKPTGRKNIL